jgi:glycosyltransferase involved in cell wall biosynthesis
MKVAVFADTYLPQINGVTNTLIKLLEYYEKTGIEYKLFVPKYETDGPDYNVERFYSIKFFLYPEARVTFPNFWRINAALAGFKPDLVHNMTEFNMGATGLGYGKAHDVPTISNYTTNFSQYADYYKLYFLKLPIWNWMKWFHTQNDLTLCPSLDAQRLLRSHGITNTGIFSRGSDTGNFNPSNRKEAVRERLGIAGKTAFLYVGRIAVEKDLDVLCHSYSSIRRKYGDSTALVITGDGPYLERCRQMFPDGTVFTGLKRGKELAEIYASCDVFVCPSSTETFGNVVLEAMASGLPVIGSAAGGVGELISNGINGLEFKKQDEKGLAECMERLLLEAGLRDSLRRSGREFAQSRSWDKIFEGLIGVYKNILVRKELGAIGA